ncbi:MAG: hypothetical protein M3340_13540 [Actinomycetota bacterium]|nr:hypothetical protein [Actinomycetota bacterium]
MADVAEQQADELTVEQRIAAAPLTFDYWIVPSIDFRTTVTGANRDQATVQIFYVNTPMYSTTLTPMSPDASIPTIQAGDFTITDGGLHLTVPTPTTSGSVALSCTLTRKGQQPVIVGGLPIANWPLSSTS